MLRRKGVSFIDLPRILIQIICCVCSVPGTMLILSTHCFLNHQDKYNNEGTYKQYNNEGTYKLRASEQGVEEKERRTVMPGQAQE